VTTAPLGSLSVDLDDEWAYRRAIGDPGWRARTSYFAALEPRLERVLEGRRATCFAVGADARRPEGAALLRGLHERGHEVASHSDDHDLHLHRRPRAAIERDLDRSAEALAAATGTPPVGFRAPGYGTSAVLRRALVNRGYRYDASAFPTPVGLLSRLWFGRHTRGPRLGVRDVRDRIAELARGAQVRRIRVDGWVLVEVPVTVVPYVRLPIHASHLLLFARRAPRFAERYLDRALAICARSGIGPAVVLHPTDLLDSDDSPAIRRFPNMAVAADLKLALVQRWLELTEARFALGTVAEQAAAAL
jgi:peptidoglycan-N-acetylglucosamine deacetylase